MSRVALYRHVVHVVIVGLTLAMLATALVVEAQDAGRPKHDPFQGMERSGRIPKVPLPADLPNPERWRYLPEGRIKPGNIFVRFGASRAAAERLARLTRNAISASRPWWDR